MAVLNLKACRVQQVLRRVDPCLLAHTESQPDEIHHSARLLVACEFKGQKSTGGGGSGNEVASVPGLPLTNYVRVLIARGWENRSSGKGHPELRFSHPRAIKTRT